MKTILWFGFALVAISAGKVIFTKVGGKAILDCGPRRFTKELVWNRENALIMSVNGKSGFVRRGTIGIVGRSKVRQETNLEISKVTEEDAGRFTCKADDTIQEHRLLVVSVSVSPSGVLQEGQEATLRCQVKDLNPTVEWKKPNGISHTSQTVELKPVAGSDAGTWTCTVTYDGEKYSESLSIEVGGSTRTTTTSYNSHNSKDNHKPTGINRATDHPSSDAVLLLLGLSWWVWLAVGLGGLVVILLMVFVIILCKRVRRRKKKFQKMKNTQQPLERRKYCQCGREAAATKPQQGRRREKPSALPLQPC